MSYGVPTHGNDYRVDPALTAQVRAQLANNAAFQQWAKGYHDLGITSLGAPSKFGITLPQGAWIDSNGNVQTNPGFVSSALSPSRAWPLYAAATLGTVGALNAGGAPAATTTATSGGPLPATVPGSYASNLYASGGFASPSATAAGLAGAGGLGTVAGAAGAAGGAGGAGGAGAAAGASGGAGRALLDQLTSGQGIAGLAGLLTTLAMRPNGGGGGSGDPFSTNPQLQHLLDVSSQRVDRTDPLHQSITQLAMSRLPTNVQR